MASPSPAVVLMLKAIQAWDRLRLRARSWQHPGLRIDPAASSNLAAAHFDLAPTAVLEIGAGVTTERRPAALRFMLEAGAQVEVEAGTWLRTQVADVVIWAGPDARIRIGREAFLNGCHLSAKSSLSLGYRTQVGYGSRLIDSDQHDLDNTRTEQSAPIVLGDHVWVAGDVTVLRGVQIGDHAVIGARSLVTADVPAHTLAFGIPARPQGQIGDRSQTR